MLIISSREFRENQKSYLDKIDDGIEILIRRGKTKSYKIMPVSDDDTLMSKDDFFAKLDKSYKQYLNGESLSMRPNETLTELLERAEQQWGDTK